MDIIITSTKGTHRSVRTAWRAQGAFATVDNFHGREMRVDVAVELDTDTLDEAERNVLRAIRRAELTRDRIRWGVVRATGGHLPAIYRDAVEAGDEVLARRCKRAMSVR